MCDKMLIEERANAKLNLHLEVLGKREDGFHDIYSIMVKTELHDKLFLKECSLSESASCIDIEIIPGKSEFSYLMEEIPWGENLIAIAAGKYLEKTGYGGRIVFEIEKNIPAGGGMGGGSSDAASAIRLLCRHLGRSIDEKAFQAASETGSDIPFFLMDGAAVAESRGEILTGVNVVSDGYVLLVNAGISVNTGQAYRMLGRKTGAPAPCIMAVKDELRQCLSSMSMWKSCFRNDFEEVVFEQHPVLKLIRDEMDKAGALFSLMTGSGSTLFAVFENEADAEKLRDSFRNKKYWTVITKIVN